VAEFISTHVILIMARLLIETDIASQFEGSPMLYDLEQVSGQTLLN
jgi:hypothetical protein